MMKTTTLAERSIKLNGGPAYIYAAQAKANGMTNEQFAAAMMVQSCVSHLTAEAKEVVASKDSALPALDRVAALTAEAGDPKFYDALNAAILG